MKVVLISECTLYGMAFVCNQHTLSMRINVLCPGLMVIGFVSWAYYFMAFENKQCVGGTYISCTESWQCCMVMAWSVRLGARWYPMPHNTLKVSATRWETRNGAAALACIGWLGRKWSRMEDAKVLKRIRRSQILLKACCILTETHWQDWG